MPIEALVPADRRASGKNSSTWRGAQGLPQDTDLAQIAGMKLRVTVTKRTDGGSVLRCVREDGSITWQKLDGRLAGFFPIHDLTHFVVETALGCRRAFYGLIAEGWDIDDTTGKTQRGPLPDEALFVEHLVGMFDGERASGSRGTAADINYFAAAFATQGGRPVPRPITEAELARIRTRLAELMGRWNRLPPGGTLELEFPGPTT